MKEPTPKILATLLAAALARTAAAAPALTADVAVSSAATPSPGPILFRFGFEKPTGPAARPSLGARGGLSEGKPLEMLVWSASGAVAGSLAGPPGAILGAAAGAVGGLLIAVFAVPHNGPDRGLDKMKP